MTKESKTFIENNKIIFREPFLSESDIASRGGTLTDVSISNSIAVFNGSSSKIEYSQTLSGVQSVQINLILTTTTEDILKLSSSHSVEVGAGTVTATGFSSPTIYVDGVATTTITTGKHQIIVTTATIFVADDIVYGNISGFLNGSIDLSIIYNYSLSSDEVENLFQNRRFHELTGQTEIINISSQSGTPIDRWGNSLTLTNVDVVKQGDLRVMLYDGSTSKMDCGNPHDLTGDITCVAWVKPYGWGEGSGGRGSIINNGQLVFAVYGLSDSYLFHRGGGEGARPVNVSTNLNEWQMVVVTSPSSGAGSNIYINGTLGSVTPFNAATPAAGTNLIIGDRNAGARAFDGLLSGVRIYQSILSANEISQMYSSESKKYSI